MAKILLVEDDSDLAAGLMEFLKNEGHNAERVDNGNEARDRLRLYQYDLALLDWELPGATGIEICREYRAAGGNIPILMMTGRSSVSDKITGLDIGADDYLPKPFEFRELASRLRALLRRQNSVVSMTLKIQDLELNSTDHWVKRAGKTVELTALEFAILEYMMKHADQVISPEMLLNGVWNSESDATVDSVYTLVKNLRKKLNDKQTLIKTVYGIGYKLTS